MLKPYVLYKTPQLKIQQSSKTINFNHYIKDWTKNKEYNKTPLLEPPLPISIIKLSYTPLFMNRTVFTLFAINVNSEKIRTLNKLFNDTLAVIGTRSCHISTYKKAFDIIKRTIKQTNAKVLISGGARGCDTIAESYAIKANFLFIKILPTFFTIHKKGGSLLINPKTIGFEKRFKKDNIIMLAPSLVIPQYKYKYFLRYRNFFIALLAKNILALQTPKASGTLIALQYATHLNKTILFPNHELALLKTEMFNGQLILQNANIGLQINHAA